MLQKKAASIIFLSHPTQPFPFNFILFPHRPIPSYPSNLSQISWNKNMRFFPRSFWRQNRTPPTDLLQIRVQTLSSFGSQDPITKTVPISNYAFFLENSVRVFSVNRKLEKKISSRIVSKESAIILFSTLQGVKLLTYLYQLCLEHSSSTFYPILLSLLRHSVMPYIT